MKITCAKRWIFSTSIKRWLVGIAVVYVLLWAVTMIWGPASANAEDIQRQQNYYGSMGADPEVHGRRLTRFTVPAPFVVMAEWEHGNTNRAPYSKGSLWGFWFPDIFWIVEDRMWFVACG
jgi:hypothetical protein